MQKIQKRECQHVNILLQLINGGMSLKNLMVSIRFYTFLWSFVGVYKSKNDKSYKYFLYNTQFPWVLVDSHFEKSSAQ